jgi:hypothetical protein
LLNGEQAVPAADLGRLDFQIAVRSAADDGFRGTEANRPSPLAARLYNESHVHNPRASKGVSGNGPYIGSRFRDLKPSSMPQQGTIAEAVPFSKKFQIRNKKFQINSKFKSSNSKSFGILDFSIGIYLGFLISNLDFT